MSHFAIAVITENRPSEEELAAILQPWHEYECTGIDDQYVIDVDETDKLEEALNEDVRVVQLADGKILSRYEDQFWVVVEDQEGRHPWDRKTEFKLPDGAIEKEMVQKDFLDLTGESVEDFAEEYGGWFKKEDGRYYRKTNPNRKWDWWVVGGRWSAFYNGLDQNQIKDIPFDQMMAEARQEAADRYHKAKAVLGIDVVPSWKNDYMTRADAGEITWDEARETYNSHPVVTKLLEAKLDDIFGPPIEEYNWPLEQYVDAWGMREVSLFAIVKDGEWIERGSMGWWGVVTDEKDRDEWAANYYKFVIQYPNHWLTVVDCHI